MYDETKAFLLHAFSAPTITTEGNDEEEGLDQLVAHEMIPDKIILSFDYERSFGRRSNDLKFVGKEILL